MDYARDLGRVDVWEESLKRSLERRGKPRRSSVELYKLRPERDLTLGDVLDRSASYSELRRRAAQRTAMPRPSVALGGISALALVAGATVPSLLGGGQSARKERVAYAADAHSRARAEAAVHGNWGGAVQAGGSSAQAVGSTAASRSQGAGYDTSASPGSVSDASASHASGHTVLTRATTVRPAARDAAVSGGVAVSPGGGAVAHQATVEETTRLASDTTSVEKVLPGTGSEPQTHVAANTVVTPSDGTVVTPSSGGTVVTPGPTTEPVVPQRPAGPGTGDQVTGDQPVRTTPTPTTPTRTPTTTTGTPAPTETPTTTTGNNGPAPNVQVGLNRMIAAGNEIATRPYVYGGGHASFDSDGYDCSGSVSYVLHAAGLLNSPEDSTELESYGMSGQGRYVTVYANPDHAWMTIEGRRFDTVALAETGSRWSDTMASTAGFVARHPRGY